LLLSGSWVYSSFIAWKEQDPAEIWGQQFLASEFSKLSIGEVERTQIRHDKSELGFQLRQQKDFLDLRAGGVK
jgi:hypothetical protein